MQLQGKKIQNREVRIKRISTKKDAKNVVKKPLDRTSVKFKRTRLSKNAENFQGEIVKSKFQKKVIKLFNLLFSCTSAFNTLYD